MNKNTSKKPLFDRRGKSGTYAVIMSLILLAVLAVVKHISNIKRLLNGTESRFTKKKDREEKEEK